MSDDGLTPNLLRGATLFNEKKYWDAHEEWEAAWRGFSGPQRDLLQAYIQICALCLKINAGEMAPAMSLARGAIVKLSANRESELALTIENAGEVLEFLTAPGGEKSLRAAQALLSKLKAVAK
jgi:predicted metal-dependent hydrolase